MVALSADTRLRLWKRKCGKATANYTRCSCGCGCTRNEVSTPRDHQSRRSSTTPNRQDMSSPPPSPRLTVLLITYNHADYVGKSVESILLQRIDEPFSIVVADDASTDDTVPILRDYAEASKDIPFIFLDNSEHLGVTRNYRRAFAACSSDYVAIMEGDDYWISPYKLARQRDFLDSHWECDLCAVNYLLLDQSDYRFSPAANGNSGYTVFGSRELILGKGVASNFSTCMYRQKALIALPNQVFELLSYDWIINICVGRNGLIGFLHEPMSVYRVHVGGAWSRLSHTEKLKRQLALLPDYDVLTDGAFHPEFRALATRLRVAIAQALMIQLTPPIAQPLVRSFFSVINFVASTVLRMAKLVVAPAAVRSLFDRVSRGRRE